ncbi:enoyl-CoA hydratase/isomerase family protein [Kribbella shirazensis]|uniref:Enoyl-CoA hydratase/carnithine racemase n=1 Tax=Kribbella shirazensis TaxID=1105143 RepID=A0A7X5VHL1_9ACTN|nr:enoyl-CoA hydratase/isomerase family protein [Kribbella shirazensis]NIK61374.1 enoyl-CoA hydratase/carnithine racemase [Kribbella shirazensis]
MNSLQFHVTEISDAFWRASFNNGPVNLIDLDTIEQLGDLVTRIEEAPALTVVVFDSPNVDFFMAHWDITADRARLATMKPGQTGLHPYADNLVRLSKVPAVTVAAVRGRARGAGSEFLLATDIRFASENAVIGQVDVGLGAVPGGGAMARLARLVGRARAAEIVLGADDFPAALAERYGYVNRVLPDNELDDFVDRFARRIAGFDKTVIVGAKALLDLASLPADEEFGPGMAALLRTAWRPANAARMRDLLDRGLQTPSGVELDLGRAVGEAVAPRGEAHADGRSPG